MNKSEMNILIALLVFKVFSQNNLIQLLKEAESSATMENDAITIFNNNLINERFVAFM